MSVEILFYHLTKRRLEDVLPGLLETCLARDWRVVVQAGSAERLEALDAFLWTGRDDTFLPHGLDRDKYADRQPICLTCDDANPNSAGVRFFVDGAMVGKSAVESLRRAVVIFDGRDETALASARAQWNVLKNEGLAPTYWQQTNDGRWEKQESELK